MLASDPTFPLFPIFAFVAFVLSVIPLSWHLQAWNSGTCAFMIWVGSLCLVLFVNSLVWADSAINVAPVWCDISCQIILGAGVGIPASTLCISRRLYRIISTQTVTITRDDKRRAIYQDMAIAVGLPILVLVLHVIVQPHRFNILEQNGCSPATYNTLPSYFLFYSWPILIGAVSFVYSSLTLRTFYIRRLQFNQILASNNAINPSRYIRLMLLAIVDIACTLPVGVFTIYINLKGVTLAPWVSWENTHFDFGRVILVPAVIWRSDPTTVVEFQINRWLPVVCAFIFFALFGFAEEAMKNYRRVFWFFARRLGFRPASERLSTGKGGVLSRLKNMYLKSDDKDTLPVYVNPAISSSRRELRKSILDADSRATICFPDDAYELEAYQKSFSQNGVPSSPSSLTSTCYPVTPIGAPPSYVDTAHLDAAASELSKPEKNPYSRSLAADSFVSLPEMIIEGSERSRPSSYSSPSVHSHRGAEEYNEEGDQISMSDAYIDSHPPPSLRSQSVPVRVASPLPFSPPDIPIPPQTATAAFHRPFSPPSVYPVARPHTARDTNGIMVTVHTQSSREAF